MGIEPTSEAWEASILPLYDARSFLLTCPNYTQSGRDAYRTPSQWDVLSKRFELFALMPRRTMLPARRGRRKYGKEVGS